MKGLEKISSQSWGIKLSSTLHDFFLDKTTISPKFLSELHTLAVHQPTTLHAKADKIIL